MQLSNIPLKLTLPFAAAGAKNTIPAASQIGITAGAASLTDGFPPLTRTPVASGGVPPSGADMNGILFEMSAAIRWANAGGGYVYDSTFAVDSDVGGYPKGARVMRSDGEGYWLNTADNNTTDPEAAGAGWVPDYTSGAATVAMASANVTLTSLQAGRPLIIISGTLTANLNLVFPTYVKPWIVINNASGAYSVTCKTSSGTGVAVATGMQATVVGDGTNIVGVDVSGRVPSGAVMYVAQNSAPTGYLKANGATISRATYAALFAAIGTTFGAGDGSTTFALPDLRGEFVRGWDDGRGVDTSRAFGSEQKGTFLNIDAGPSLAMIGLRSASSGAAGVAQSDLGLDAGSLADYPAALSTAGTASSAITPVNNSEQGYGVIRPRNVALLACIKY